MYCKICFEEISADGFQKLDCGHSICRNCLSRIIEVNIRGYSTYNIRCPEVKCMRPISNELTKQTLRERKSDKLLRRFEKIEIDQLLAKDSSLQVCINDQCMHLIKTTVSDINSFISCTMCKSAFCIDCRQSDHQNKECPVRHADDINDLRQSRQVLPCPKCRINIQKIDGCNEMKCPLCHDQFCWVCGKRKGSWHYSYLNIFGCPGMQLQTKRIWVTKVKSIILLSFIMCLAVLGIFGVYRLLAHFVWILGFVLADFLLTYFERRFAVRVQKSTTILTHFAMLTSFEGIAHFSNTHWPLCLSALLVLLGDWAYFIWQKRTNRNSGRNF